MGNILEWYEFGLYAYLAPVISRIFFSPSHTELAAIINVLLIFAIGFLSRPLGGIFFGYIGDRYGRRIAILSSIMMTTIPTFLIGLLPTYAQIGPWAAWLLVLLRLFQGFPVGGEFPGTICYLTESAPAGKRAYLGSYAFFGSQIGTLLNIVECLLMEHYLAPEQLAAWGWRLSFIIGGCIGLLGFTLRYRLTETPLFSALEKKDHVTKTPIRKALHGYKKKMVYAFFIAALPLGGYYMVFVFTGIYLEQFTHTSVSLGLVITAAYLLLSTISLPLCGKLGDRYGLKKLLMSSSIAIAILSFPFYYFAGHGLLLMTAVLGICLVLLLSLHFALISQSLSGLFPTSVRFTSLAFSYNLCNMILAGTAPFFALYAVKATHNTTSPAFVLMLLALCTFTALAFLRENKETLQLEHT